jgi:hypothetical protein
VFLLVVLTDKIKSNYTIHHRMPKYRLVGGRMGSEWILGILAGGCGLDSTGSGYGPMASCCECGDETSGSCATELVGLFVRV